jgi:hypothetical protein
VSRLRRLCRRMRLAYHVRCAREDAHARGITVPPGVWSCDPCRAVFLDDFSFIVHAH